MIKDAIIKYSTEAEIFDDLQKDKCTWVRIENKQLRGKDDKVIRDAEGKAKFVKSQTATIEIE